MTCAAAAERDELLTVAEAAERFKLSPKTIYKWIKCEAIEVVRIGPTKEIRVLAASFIDS